MVFGSSLRDRLTAAADPTSGRLAFAGSIMFGTVTLVGTVAMAWIPASKAFGDVPVAEGELAYLAPQLGFGLLLLGGGATAAFMLVAAGLGSARSRALPAWLGWAGVVIGVLVFVFGVFFLPMVLLLLWVLIAAIVSLRTPVTRTATVAVTALRAPLQSCTDRHALHAGAAGAEPGARCRPITGTT